MNAQTLSDLRDKMLAAKTNKQMAENALSDAREHVDACTRDLGAAERELMQAFDQFKDNVPDPPIVEEAQAVTKEVAATEDAEAVTEEQSV